MKEKKKSTFLIAAALFSLLIGYSAELSSFYFQMLRPETFRVLRPVHEYRQPCTLPAASGAYCSDLYSIPAQELDSGLDRTLGIGMFAGDLKFGCFDGSNFQEQLRFGNPDRPGHLSNPYREFRAFPLDGLMCMESVAIAVFPRTQDARHGHVAGRFVVGQSEDMHDFRKLMDFLQNQILVAGSLLCLLLFLTSQSFLRMFSNSEHHHDLYVAMVYVTASCLFTSGLTQCLFPLPENQIFYRKLVSFSDLLSEFVLWRYMLRTRVSVFLAPLNWLLKPSFKVKNDLLQILLSPISISIFVIFCLPIWSKAFVYSTCVVSF